MSAPPPAAAAAGAAPVLFTFPDGRLRYDCHACQRPCCRGLGLSVDMRGPQRKLLQAEPLLYARARPWSDSLLFVETLPSGCRLLGRDGACLVHGQAERPGSCVAYPFTVLGLAEGALYLGPDMACPLRVVPDGGCRHADLAAALGAGLPIVPEDLGPRLAGSRFERELVLRDAAAAVLDNGDDYRELCAFTLALEAQAAEQGDQRLAVERLERSLALQRPRLAALRERWQRLVALPEPAPAPPSSEGLAPSQSGAVEAGGALRVGTTESSPDPLAATMAAWHCALRLFGPWPERTSFGLVAALFHQVLQGLASWRPAPPEPAALIQLFSALLPLLSYAPLLDAGPREGPMSVDRARPDHPDGERAERWLAELLAQAPSAPMARIAWLRARAPLAVVSGPPGFAASAEEGRP